MKPNTLIRRFSRTFGLLALSLFTLQLTACDSDANTDDGPSQNVVEIAVANDFNTLVAAVQAAGLADDLQGPGPFTVFAPTDAAFAKLPDGTVETLLMPENRDQLVAILTYHVVSGAVTSDEVVNLSSAPTLQGEPISISVSNGTVQVNTATVTAVDIEATNGVVHVIDEVLLPPSLTSQ